VIYGTGMSDCSAGRQRKGIWRCLVVSVDAGTAAGTIRQFERDLLLMPTFVKAIRNWALSPVILAGGQRRWTHIWEQEFDDVAGLEGEYMMHPIHWGLVDGWFDPECPQRIADPWLIHASIDISSAVIR
jgi:Stress responsive A/B Barrel Domain